MTKKEMEAIKKIVEYLETDESEHYEECEPHEREHHIYRSVLVLQEILEKY